jgi:hypothetical protein
LAELPSNWGMTTQARPDGKLDIVAKDDIGNPYRVRITDGNEVTPKDVEELHQADREATSAKEAVSRIVESGQRRKQQEESRLLDDLTEAAGPVVRAGLEREGCFVGSTRRYRQAYDQVFGG